MGKEPDASHLRGHKCTILQISRHILCFSGVSLHAAARPFGQRQQLSHQQSHNGTAIQQQFQQRQLSFNAGLVG